MSDTEPRNPYVEGSHEYGVWRLGYKAAQRDAPRLEGLDVALQEIAEEGFTRSKKPNDDAYVLASMARVLLTRLSDK